MEFCYKNKYKILNVLSVFQNLEKINQLKTLEKIEKKIIWILRNERIYFNKMSYLIIYWKIIFFFYKIVNNFLKFLLCKISVLDIFNPACTLGLLKNSRKLPFLRILLTILQFLLTTILSF